MPSTYSDLLRIEKMANGEQDSTWGTQANNVFEILEDAIAGRAAVTHDDTANYTLSTANGTEDEARKMILNIGGALGAARNVVVPTSSKLYVAKNATTGGYATTLKTTAGTGISVPNGKTTLLFCDGTNVVDAIDYLSSLTVGGALSVTPANASVTLSPTGTGTVTIAPATAGAMNNVVIGGSTPLAGTFTTINATGNVTLGNAADDAHTVNGQITITDDAVDGLIVARSGGGDKIYIGGQAAGDGAEVSGLNAAGSDYTPLTLFGNGVMFRSRTGAASTAEIARVTSTGLGVFCTPTYELDVTRSDNGADMRIRLANLADSVGSSATLHIAVGGTSGADAAILFEVPGGSSWIEGIDNSAADSYKISLGSALGTNDYLTIDTSGNTTLGGTLTTSAPTGGAGAWELGVANAVSPTAPNRTLTVEIGGTVYYIAAKTTND